MENFSSKNSAFKRWPLPLTDSEIARLTNIDKKLNLKLIQHCMEDIQVQIFDGMILTHKRKRTEVIQ